jgi:hypothetical protein
MTPRIAAVRDAMRALTGELEPPSDSLAGVDETNEQVALDYLERVVGVRAERTSPAQLVELA